VLERVCCRSQANWRSLAAPNVSSPLRIGREPEAPHPLAGVGGAPATAATSAATTGGVGGASISAAPVGNAPSAGSALPAAGSGGQSEVCGREQYHAEQAPLTIYTLFDDSISMLLWWGPVTDAFTRFVRDPRSAGISIGLKFFGTDCEPATYSKPDVAIGSLPQNADAIASLLAAHVPLAQTPTRQVMQGATMALSSYATTHPREKTVTCW